MILTMIIMVGEMCSSAVVGPKIADQVERIITTDFPSNKHYGLTCKVVKINGRLFIVNTLSKTWFFSYGYMYVCVKG